ncbi:DUF1501 domain-containing protein [Tuwongella immobilis]|uniref:DUF1501 domain-containing protein n=1 Tax=Tuwongella immobilis TaxID=692036 RepID=A0A6C2YJZ6_9BACT|nr:DUF1501 domain-containing protein [Tuwongella immobilis]VIP01697.1 hypothetical protein : Uncharacterized protein OS=Pirellula staleyi (strain ATCC 27377 / DSM 6068 / ICPB 4128) GN=Psta_2356 PE=4 SV=1: DUF1501 [Tuwongella immobilis]VTR99179.1 hypothetical protein : Uncharacterized protein OS=Pirellula staleyi (strain ATCC 27377 / DSM 6068 / ICPB 4128) GN=Psta_2356 PE=4 SV=1: DUF1501 [Tuwongella immobilis]
MQPLHRRHLLQLGGTMLGGMTLPGLLQAESIQPRSRRATAKSVVYLHQFGGPSQYETFDMKPDAPAEIRGSFKPISSSVPGTFVCEMLPRLAKLAHRYTLIRSVQHTMKNHNSAAYVSLSGYTPPVDDIRLRDTLDLFPAFGSVVDHLSPARPGVPSFVSYPYVLRDGSITPGQHASFLGKKHNPLFFTQDPNSPDFRLPELTLPQHLTLDRLESRTQVMRLLDEQSKLLETSALAQGMDESVQRAVSMLTSPGLRKAFDLSSEPAALRDRYGRTTYGQSCLLARRLVEAGAKFLNVYLSPSIGGTSGWDTHGFNNQPMDPILKKHLLPLTDQAVSAFLEDLDDRGLLDSTLVVWMGEFGRTPRINKLAGRDHWPQCYTVLLAGGGTKPGMVYGSSDKQGAYPASGLVTPGDIAASMFEALGIASDTHIRDRLNRPFPIANGKPILDVFA